MRLGITAALTDQDLAPATLAAAVEELGFDSLYLPEHTHLPVREDTPPALVGGVRLDDYKRCLDPLVALSTAAAVTTRIGLGTGILLAAQHEPILLAKQVATLDHLSGGRVTLGVGYGWNRTEAEDHGVDWARRHDVVREHLAAAEAIWSTDQAEFHGEFVDFGPTWSWPKPVQQPRVRTLVGGGANDAVLSAVVESADGWIPIGGSGLAAAIPACTPWPPKPGGTRPNCPSSRSGPLPTRASSSTTPASASPRSCCGSGPATSRPSGGVGVVGPAHRVRGHTGATMTDLRRRHAALGSTTPLPKIISVDDHIVEPPHLWDTWLPARWRDRGPKAERRGIGDMEHIGGGTYRQSFDPDGPQADCWVYEDLVYINKRHVAAVGFDRDDMTMSPITYDEMRPGLLRPQGPHCRQRGELGRGQPVLPDLPPLLRPDLSGGQGQGARRGVRHRLQRLHGRGVVRRQRRPPAPALPHSVVGRRQGGRRGAAQRRPRRARGLLQRDPAPPRAAQHPQRVLGSVLRRLCGDAARW